MKIVWFIQRKPVESALRAVSRFPNALAKRKKRLKPKSRQQAI
jgi:hypothetical protein